MVVCHAVTSYGLDVILCMKICIIVNIFFRAIARNIRAL